MTPFLVAAFLLGVVGSAHCVAMCGGILGTLSAGISPDLRRRPPVHLGFVLAYNLGRVASYAFLGALLGALSSTLVHALAGATLVLRAAAGLFTLALGLYLAGILPSLSGVERVAAPLWRRVAPFAARLLPVRSWTQAFTLGALWGWVPCTMVYTAAAIALAAATPLSGAATMAAFGVGTLLAMMLTGAFAGHALAAAGRQWVRRAAGTLLAVLGAITLATAAPNPDALHGAGTHTCGAHAE